MLLEEIKAASKATQERPANRKLAAVSDTKDHKGLRIKSDKAVITFGAKEDVKLIRTGSKKLTLTGSLVVESLSSKKITVDGKPVGGGSDALVKRIADLEGALSSVWDGLKCGGNGGYDTKTKKCKCDEDYTGADCKTNKKTMHAHPRGKGKSPCEIIAANGDKSDGKKTLYLDGKKTSFYCEGGWMKVYSIGCLRKCDSANMFGNTNAVNVAECTSKNHKSGDSCKFSDADINKYVGARGYKLQIWGSPMSGYRKPRYLKVSCNFRSDKQPSAECSRSWSNLAHTAGATLGTHGNARGTNVKLQDCISHNLASLNYANKGACLQSCGHHCHDKSCKKGEGCNQALFV